MKEFPIELIVAATPDGEIGYRNTIPWQLKGDLKRFKELTMGHVIIMGRKTFESLPCTLRGRSIVVVSPSLMQKNGGARKPMPGFQSFVGGIGCKVQFATSLHDAILVAAIDVVFSDQKIFIAGGARLYEEMLNMTRKKSDSPRLTVHLTTVYKDPTTPGYDTRITNMHLLDNFDIVGDPIEVFDEEEIEEEIPPEFTGSFFIPQMEKTHSLSHTYSTLVQR